MTRLTKRNGRNITYNEKREFICSHYCNNCSRGTGDCKILKTMIETDKLAERLSYKL